MGWGIYSSGCLARAERTWRTGASGCGRRCVHGVDGWTGADEADSRADWQSVDGRTDSWANGRMGGRADGRTGWKGRGQLGGRGWKGRGQSGGRVDGAHKARTSGRGMDRRRGTDMRTRQSGAEEARSSELGGRVDGQMGGRGGGPGFKRPHSSHPISLLGTQSACLVRAQVCKVLGSVVGSRRIPSQTPILSARTHLLRLSASVLGVEKGILLSAYKNGFNQGRWQRNAKSKASNPYSNG